MAKLVITRGLPGAGKTTYARKWVAEDPRNRARVNRDDIGVQLHGRRFYEDRELMQDTEKAITVAHHAEIRDLLRVGKDVICDDTNLPRRVARDLRNLAVAAGADFEIVDMLDVPLETVYAQNLKRLDTPAFVPESEIKRMAERHTGRNAYEIPLAPEPDAGGIGYIEPYVLPEGKPEVQLVDMDGTMALMGTRSPYDESRVHEDRPNEAVIRGVTALARTGVGTIVMSARTKGCQAATEQWVLDHAKEVEVLAMFMREVGDMRKDRIVKLELFNEHIRHNYRVVAVWDDRKQVVEMWRALGLTVFHVADGNF